MTTVKAYCGLAKLELAQPESRRKLNLARDHIEAGLSMVKEILPNSINQVELLIVRGDIELIEKNLSTAEKTFNEALKMLGGKQHPIRPTIYANLAYIYVEKNQNDEAKEELEKCLTSFKDIYGQDMLDECTIPSYAFCHVLKAKIILKSIIKSDHFALAYQLASLAFLMEKNEEDEAQKDEAKKEEEQEADLQTLKGYLENPKDEKSLDDVKKSLEITKKTFNNAFITLKIDLKNKRGSGMLQELGWLHLKSGQFDC